MGSQQDSQHPPAAPRIFVTGATGNVGAALTRSLLATGADVRVGARDPGSREWPAGAEAVRFDFADRGSFAPALAGIERLFLLRPPAISDIASTLAPCVDAAVAAGTRQVVFLSVIGADRMGFIPHAKVEAHVEQSGVETWCFLRAGFFAQNLSDTYASDIRGDDRIYLPAGRGKAAFVDAADLGELASLALTEPLDDPRFARRAPSLTGPEALDFDAVAELLSAALGRVIRYEPASALGHYLHLRRGGLSRGQAAVITALHVGLRFGQAERVEPDLEELLGRRPRSLGEWIAAHRSEFIEAELEAQG